MPRAKERRTSRLWLTQHAARKTQSNCDAAVDAATDGARPAPRPEVIAVAAEVCPPARRSSWAPPERLAGGRERLSLCAGAPGGGKGPQMAFLAAGPAARGAAALAPRARHRAMTRARVGPAEPGLKARGQLQRPCTHGAHGELEAAAARMGGVFFSLFLFCQVAGSAVRLVRGTGAPVSSSPRIRVFREPGSLLAWVPPAGYIWVLDGTRGRRSGACEAYRETPYA